MDYLERIRKKILKFQRQQWKQKCKRLIRNDNFTIIASNCLGSSIYQVFDREYLTPTVGLFLYAPCFVKFAAKLEHYVDQPLRFLQTSQYDDANKMRSEKGWYPIALMDDVEIHFLHYKSEEEAETKWNRRKMRINYNNLFFSMTDRDGCSEEHIRLFNDLPYKNKVCFTAKNLNKKYRSTVWLKKYEGQPFVGDLTVKLKGEREMRKRFNVVEWLNSPKVL